MDFHLLIILSCLLVAGTAHDCDGGNHGIPCCPHYVNGDMSGGNELNIKFSPRTEVGCQNSCKVQHPSSIGVTQNNAGTSCYCEFGSPRLIGTSSYWKTCLFSTEISDTTTTTPATTSATSTTTNIIDDTTITSTPTTAAASTSPTEKRSSAGSPNNFLDAFYAQWTCNEKDELFNEYEMTSLIFKETLKIFIKMTEGNKLSNCYTNDVTRSTSNGPQVMYLYTSRNHMCNNTQHILTTFNTFNNQSSSNSVSCLLHHPTRITSTAFVATAVCANIYDKIDLSPAIASVTCLGDEVNLPKNGNWNLLFRQTINGKDELFKKNEWTRNKENVDAPNYSILGDFEKFRKPDGSFHLFLWYPELGTGNEWVQTSNPVTKTSGGVDNYKGILTPYTGYAWGGLEHNNGAALLDGSLDSGLWWYAIGSTTDYSGGIPGPKDDKAHHVVKKVELYINYQDFCFEYDIHHVGLGLLRKQGGDNNYGGTGSARDCQLLCQQTDGCQWFNWLKAEDECWLKSGKGDQTQDRPGGVTGPRTCPPVVAETGDGWTFMPSTVTSLTTIEVNDHTKCCAKCKEVAPDTQMYNFNKKEKKCYCIKPHPGVTPSTEQKSDTVAQFCTGKPNGCFVKGECNNKKQDWSVERWDTWGCENLNSCTDKDACQGRPKTLFEFCENNEDQPFISRFIKDEVEIMFIFPEGATMFDYCSISTDHTMCKYSGPSTTCKANTIKRDLSDADKQAIVKKHNELRGKVANGLEKRGQPGPQPAASDMLLMVWDDELATIAQRWADQCTYEHDTKRNVKGDTNGHVGQNVYIRYSTAEMTDADLFDSCVLLATTKWYEEVKHFDKDNVNSFKASSSDSVTGHYTQVVWGSSRAVGCGSVYYKSSSDYPYHHLVICNYFKGGNIIDGAMYSLGTACSACPSGYPTCSDGLCH